MFFNAHSFLRATLSENCSLEQIVSADKCSSGLFFIQLYIVVTRSCHALVVTQRAVEPNSSAAFHIELNSTFLLSSFLVNSS